MIAEASPGAPSAPSARRRARERALELLYESEAKGVEPAALLGELPVRPEPYAVVLVSGVSASRRRLDQTIEQHATGWALDRMPVVDRQLLRIATYELDERPEVPVAVVLDEAVELAKLYSTEDSSRFVNGVLVAIARSLRPGEIAPA